MPSAVKLGSSLREPKREESISPLAGQLGHKDMLVDLARLEHEYFAHHRGPLLPTPAQPPSLNCMN